MPTGKGAAEIARALTFSGTEVEREADLGDDTQFQLEVTSNRVDCLGVIGLAREIGAVFGIPLKLPEPNIQVKSEEHQTRVEIEADALAACPYYSARIIRGVRVGPSPDWLRDRLETSLPQVKGIATVTISALTGRNLDRLMAAVFKTYELWNTRIPTGELNRWLEALVARHPPPAAGGRRLRLRYITQAKARPPTFILFTGRPQHLSSLSLLSLSPFFLSSFFFFSSSFFFLSFFFFPFPFLSFPPFSPLSFFFPPVTWIFNQLV